MTVTKKGNQKSVLGQSGKLVVNEVGCVESHFLDSGAFTLWTKAAKYAKEHPKKGRWAYYDTQEFWDYSRDYAAFVKKYQIGIDLYANIDVIPNPELTWRNQQHLEKKYGLKPVPVVHYKTDLKWLKHYINLGYEVIGLGGLVGSTASDSCKGWIDRCFNFVCDNPKRLPCVKLHGFGVTNFDLMIRYPWWSVDSTSWTKIGAYGGILVPHKRKGAFVFDEQPYVVKMSSNSPDSKLEGRHFNTLRGAEREIVVEWLAEIDVPLGKGEEDKEKEPEEFGVINRHSERKVSNLLFFERLRKSLPEWPWPFRSTRVKGFAL